MPDLSALSPLADLDTRHGSTILQEAPIQPLHWLAPFPGQTAALSASLTAAIGLAWPEPGTVNSTAGMELRWAGRAQALLIGATDLPEDLPRIAAVTDVSNVYARLLLTGPDAPAVLARLTPLDLRTDAFPSGRTARSLLGHIPAQFTARKDGVEVAIMSSFAHSAAHEIDTAMRAVAARAEHG